MDLMTLTYLNILVIVVVLVIMSGVLYSLRKDQLRMEEQNTRVSLETAATLGVAREILRQVKK
jgi:cytochrome c biogenesis factor